MAALLVLAAIGPAACDRTPRLIPETADSTAAIPTDSTALVVQRARELWDSADGASEAARITARVMHDALRLSGRPLGARAREFVDSLGFGAEVEGRDSFAVVNLFQRANPAEGSWPWLYWRDGTGTRAQALEAGGMRLVGAATDPEGGTEARPSRLAAAFLRNTARGLQPFVFVWRRVKGQTSWTLSQSLGPDSLGGIGTLEFEARAADGTVLVSRTYRVARGFDECPSCPHVFRTRRFRWGPEGLESSGDAVQRSAYASLIQFIQALVAGLPEEAARWTAERSVVDAALGAQFQAQRGVWRLAPGSAPDARELLVFRGTSEAYRVHFAPRGDDWVLTSIERTTRTVE